MTDDIRDRLPEIGPDEFTGRSLTMRDYLTRVLEWTDSPIPGGGRALQGAPFEERLEALRQEIVHYEMLQMFRRIGGDEDWAEIRRSGQGGRWE